MNDSFSQDSSQYEQQQQSLSQSSQQTPINNNQQQNNSQKIQLFIRFSQQQFSQMAIQENQPQQDIFFYTDKENQRLFVIDYMVISLEKLYQSSTLQKLQKKMFLEKLKQKLSQISRQSQRGQILHKVVQMKGLQFVKEYWIWRFNLSEYNKSYEDMQQCKVKLNKIPQQIATIYLPGLRSINLKKCQIDNIESLIFINAPQLTEISLKKNNIFNLSPLQKCHFPKLLFIRIQKNPINNLQNFYRGDFKYFSIQPRDYLQQQNGILGIGFTFLFEKILIEKMRYLYVNGFNFNTSPCFKRLVQFQYARKVLQ